MGAARRQWLPPALAGRIPVGVLGLLAVGIALLGVGSSLGSGFGSAAVPELPPASLHRGTPDRAAPLPETPAISSPAPEAPETAPPPPAAAPPQRSDNRPPVIERVEFANAQFTARGDLRLLVEAWDPDGDRVQVRTRWELGDRRIETEQPVLGREHIRRGDRVRASVVALDGASESEAVLTPSIEVENAAPLITTFPRGFDANGAFVYPLGAIDLDGDRALQFLLLEGPEGMRLEAHEGTITWRPRADQLGRYRVQLEVRDGRGGRESQVFVLDVHEPAARAPQLADR